MGGVSDVAIPSKEIMAARFVHFILKNNTEFHVGYIYKEEKKEGTRTCHAS